MDSMRGSRLARASEASRGMRSFWARIVASVRQTDLLSGVRSVLETVVPEGECGVAVAKWGDGSMISLSRGCFSAGWRRMANTIPAPLRD